MGGRVGSYLRENHRRLRLKIEERLTQPFLNTADEYMWLLKKLQLPSNKIVLRGVDFFISEICFYKDGEAASLFLNRDFSDNTLKEIQKERLTNIFIRKTFNERRRKYREKLAQITRDSHNETMKKKPMGVIPFLIAVRRKEKGRAQGGSQRRSYHPIQRRVRAAAQRN